MYLAILIAFCLYPQDVDEQRQKWLDYYGREVDRIQVFLGEDSVQLKRNEKSLIDWTNNVRYGQTNGSVFVWPHEGRVAVVGTVFSHGDRRAPSRRVVARSMLRMCEAEVVAKADGVDFWKPSDVGMLRAQRITSVEVPSTDVKRLTQMRRIAATFSADIVETDNVERSLRLMRTPIYRYEPVPNSKAIDGAMFVFSTEGTDPEALLLLEAIQDSNGTHWEYAIGRFTKVDIRVYKDSNLIWEPARPTTGSNYDTDRYTSMPEKL